MVCPNCFGFGSTHLHMTPAGADEQNCPQCNGKGCIPETLTPMFILTRNTQYPWIFARAHVVGGLAKVSDDPIYGTFYARHDGHGWRRIERLNQPSGYGV